MNEGCAFDHRYDEWEEFWLKNNTGNWKEWWIVFGNRPEIKESKCLECQIINLRWMTLGIKEGFLDMISSSLIVK